MTDWLAAADRVAAVAAQHAADHEQPGVEDGRRVGPLGVL